MIGYPNIQQIYKIKKKYEKSLKERYENLPNLKLNVTLKYRGVTAEGGGREIHHIRITLVTS